MKEFFIEGNNLTDAYHKAIEKVWVKGEEVNHTTECAMTIHIKNPLQEPMISKLFFGGPYDLERYRQEMLDGILDFEVDKGAWEYTYHDRMVNYPVDSRKFPEIHLGHTFINQIDFVINELKNNPTSRRAVIDIRNNSDDCGSEDPTCLQHIQYMIRNNKLDCFVLFRSNDAAKASFMNMFALILLQKRIADEIGVEVGTYTHRANSFHIYERDYNLVKGYMRKLAEGDCCYNYIGEWDELMEESQHEIDHLIYQLKNSK